MTITTTIIHPAPIDVEVTVTHPAPVDVASIGIQGPPGPQGEPGPEGAEGPPGQGVPAGGTTGQVLAKASGDDFDTYWANPGGGSGPGVSEWSQAVLGSDFSVTGTGTTLVTGMAFTPEAGAIYEVYARLLLRTDDSAAGVQYGWSVPSGLSDGSIRATNPNTGTSQRFDVTPVSVSGRSFGASLSNIDTSYLGTLDALLVADSGVFGDFALTLQSESSGATATIRAGSFMRWRRVS